MFIIKCCDDNVLAHKMEGKVLIWLELKAFTSSKHKRSMLKTANYLLYSKPS